MLTSFSYGSFYQALPGLRWRNACVQAFASPLLAVQRSSSTQKRRRDLACEKLERQMTGALAVRESKPEAQETINQVRLIGVAYPYRAQTNLADQLFYHRLRRTRGAAIKEIARNSLVEWIGKVLPTIGVKGAIDRSMRGVSAKNHQTLHVFHAAASYVMCWTSQGLAVKPHRPM